MKVYGGYLRYMKVYEGIWKYMEVYKVYPDIFKKSSLGRSLAWSLARSLVLGGVALAFCSNSFSGGGFGLSGEVARGEALL